MHPKLYILTRQDLSPGNQATQAAHAAFEFCYEHGPLFREWHEDSKYLVLLAVPDENALALYRDRAERLGLPLISNYEPDFGDELTAIAIAPGPKTQRLCANVPLALREEGALVG